MPLSGCEAVRAVAVLASVQQRHPGRVGVGDVLLHSWPSLPVVVAAHPLEEQLAACELGAEAHVEGDVGGVDVKAQLEVFA